MLTNLLLVIIARVLIAIIGSISIVYTHIRLIIGGIKIKSWKWTTTKLSEYYWEGAVSIDITGAIIGKYFFNDTMIHPDGVRITGTKRKTLSYYMGVNKLKGKMYGWGLFWSKVLHLIDKNHVEDAAKKDI